MRNTKMYSGYCYLSQVIRHAVWLYHRFTAGFRKGMYTSEVIRQESLYTHQDTLSSIVESRIQFRKSFAFTIDRAIHWRSSYSYSK
jgi:hypothetical protein